MQRTGTIKALSEEMGYDYVMIPSKSETRWSVGDQLIAFYRIYEVLVVFFGSLVEKSCIGKKWSQFKEVDSKSMAFSKTSFHFLLNFGKMTITFGICNA